MVAELMRRVGLCATVLFVVGLAIPPLGATAAQAQAASGTGLPGSLHGVSADSTTDAWAVGWFAAASGAQETLALHWNGMTWATVRTPNPGGTAASAVSGLQAVTALSAHNAWSVGSFTNRTTGATETLTIHWNGTRWRRVSSPTPGGTGARRDFSTLASVSAVSAHDVWAVGEFINRKTRKGQTLTLRWNGRRWRRVASPNPGTSSTATGFSMLNSVSAVGRHDIWAVGEFERHGTILTRTLTLRWNGRKWRKKASPNAGAADNYLTGVVATSAHNAWAVGGQMTSYELATSSTMHWNGTSWSTVASATPDQANGSILNGVSAVGSSPVFAVGAYSIPAIPVATSGSLILQWDGTGWSQAASPNPGGTGGQATDNLEAVSLESATDGWAVGFYIDPTTNAGLTLLLHWDGTAWSQS